jgi:hypothetical protein
MKIIRNTAPVSDLYNQMKSGELTVNRTYQRSQGLWPVNARSYFIDSILNEFPFPKVVIRQTVDLLTRKSKREIVDGQQRLTAIRDFIEDKFRLTRVSSGYADSWFGSLDQEAQSRFLAYEVSMDVIVSATNDEVLEIFRRINSYQLPLNDAEKRHATYQGEFKWFIKEMMDLYSPVFESYGVLSLKQVSRMDDAVLLTELAQVIIDGVRKRDNRLLKGLYESNDVEFSNSEEVRLRLTESLDFIKIDLNEVLASNAIKPYMLYSLFSALVYNKYGICGLDPVSIGGLSVSGVFCGDPNLATQKILELVGSIENTHPAGSELADFKSASTATTNMKSRLTRLRVLVKALQGAL